MDGGTRVPLVIRGPGIAKGAQTDVMANGLDFYPTILCCEHTQSRRRIKVLLFGLMPEAQVLKLYKYKPDAQASESAYSKKSIGRWGLTYSRQKRGP